MLLQLWRLELQDYGDEDAHEDERDRQRDGPAAPGIAGAERAFHVLDLLLPQKPAEKKVTEMIVDVNGVASESDYVPEQDTTREKLRRLLQEGKLDSRFV